MGSFFSIYAVPTVREMSDSGLVSIQSHMFSHKRLTLLDDAQLEKELKDSKASINKILRKNPSVISYPFGVINKNQIGIVRKYYIIGFTTSSGVLSNGNSKYIIKRYQVNNNTSEQEFNKYPDMYKK
jgi:Predicted xylanase/chitin deacetylase